jgi:hypothetical protein
MDLQDRMAAAQDRLEEWIANAVQEAQSEIFAGGDELEEEDVRRINRVDKALKERGDDGIWGSVDYKLYAAEGDDGEERVAIDTFGVPLIPSDVDELGVDISQEQRERYNEVLSEFGVTVSEKVESQFEEWRDG